MHVRWCTIERKLFQRVLDCLVEVSIVCSHNILHQQVGDLLQRDGTCTISRNAADRVESMVLGEERRRSMTVSACAGEICNPCLRATNPTTNCTVDTRGGELGSLGLPMMKLLAGESAMAALRCFLR